MLEVDEATFDRVFAVNVNYYMTLAVLPLLRRQGRGVILNVGSTAGIRPRPGLTWYNGAKGAVNIISKSMAVELGPEKIRVNAICPVMGETSLLTQFMGRAGYTGEPGQVPGHDSFRAILTNSAMSPLWRYFWQAMPQNS